MRAVRNKRKACKSPAEGDLLKNNFNTAITCTQSNGYWICRLSISLKQYYSFSFISLKINVWTVEITVVHWFIVHWCHLWHHSKCCQSVVFRNCLHLWHASKEWHTHHNFDFIFDVHQRVKSKLPAYLTTPLTSVKGKVKPLHNWLHPTTLSFY